ncbi:MAG: sugar phosphate nucleotidyltransferase [Candidatus Saccharimonas sp.]
MISQSKAKSASVSKRPTVAVIAAAGFGTRFLPQTKAMPKEMLPIVDKPVIQYIVEQLVEAGVKDIIIVGSANKRAIEDHFDAPNEDLLVNLRAGGPKKQHYIDDLMHLSGLARFVYIRQKGPYGNATPLSNARHLLGNAPFFYVFADDIIESQPNVYTQLGDVHEKYGGSILTCLEVKTEKEYDSYGILSGDTINKNVIKMTGIIEKPGIAKAPSSFAHVSSFLFEPDILDYVDRGLENLKPGQEFYVSDCLIEPMIRDGYDFYGYQVKNSKRYDTGDKLGYVKTVVDFALKDPNFGDELLEYLKERIK